MAPSKSRAQIFADLEEKPVRDYDPEDDRHGASSSDEQEDDQAGTEHYVSVGESKLRQKSSASLGPKYKGARISRAALDESSDDQDHLDSEEDDDEEGSEDFDDPETADLEADNISEDDDIDSDEAFGEEDKKRFGKFTFRGSSENKKQSSEDESEDGAELDLSDSAEDSEDESDSMNGAPLANGFSDENSEDEEEDDASESDESDGQTEGKYNAMGSIAKLANADAERGQAIRTQRRHFDSLLNMRIRLQKALVAINSLPPVQADHQDHPTEPEPYQAAEDAALKLWQTIDGFRASLVPSTSAQASGKRKRNVTSDTASEALWEMMNETEGKASKRRKQTLQGWSEKTKGLADVTQSRKVISAQSDSIVSVLDDQLLQSERLVKRTRTPRSCAPLQAAKKVEQDPDIYDDADFYQLLLKELVDQRKGDSSAPGSAVPTVRWAAIKEAKTRKQVDRKASKGRKMRHNVHEKIQNFMAPEDRRTWEPEAVDRFFATLFGKRTELSEAKADVEMADAAADGEGLKLF